MRLAGFEIRRFTRAGITRAALAALTLIPLLYGALYLWAFWDPYGNLNKIPVALVDEDHTVTTSDNKTLHAGHDLADKLTDRQVFAWRVTNEAEAEDGLRDGRYHLILHIPANFSQSLTTPPDPAQDPRAGQLSVVSDDATNYLSGLLARSAFTEIRASAAEGTAGKYFERMLVGFTDLKTQTQQAADGAQQLANGADQASSGAGDLAAGADRAHAGAGQLADGLGSASRGAQQLASGLGALDAGSAQVADGADRAAAAGQLLAGKFDAVAGKAEPLLRDNAAEIARAATAIADGADAVAANIDALPALADTAAGRALAVQQGLDALVKARPELADDPAVVAVRADAAKAVQAAQKVKSAVNAADLGALKQRLGQVSADARRLAAAAPHLADDVAAARTQVDQFAAGLNALATGADQVHQGVVQARQGADQLNGGLFRLATGARQLDAGLASLSAGTRQLAGGLAQLDSGTHQLADGLAGGADAIPGYDPDTAAQRSGILADPVTLQRTAEHPATTYGVGFAPYFIALALWVGSMITYMLLRPVTRRHVFSGAQARRVALAGWLPGLAVGLAQAVALFLVLRFVLGLHPVHPYATLGFLFLTVAAFTAIMQWLGAKLGPAGRLAALALLMLQLTSSGGTYPVQTTPGFFQAIHPWLPMTYVVDALRHLINGGPAGTVLMSAAVLAGFAAGAFALTTLAARRARTLSPAKLHPALEM